jgi:hypothetical protein
MKILGLLIFIQTGGDVSRMDREEMRTGFCGVGRGGNTCEKRPLGKLKLRWEDNIKMDLQEVGWGAWTGWIWLRIGTGGRLL